MKHVRLTDITNKNDKGVSSPAKTAADEAADAGLSPRAQLDAARAVSDGRLTYNAHVGAKQARKNLGRLAKKFLPCPDCGLVESCYHTLEQRKEFWEIREACGDEQVS